MPHHFATEDIPRTRPRLRVLALDGGGIKGVFTAAVLAEFEADTGLRIVDHFDLIVGTSTGGILAIGLGLELSAETLLKLYIENGTLIFSSGAPLPAMLRWLRHLFGPKYSQRGLKAVLVEKIGGRRLGNSTTRLVIPTFDTLKGVACTFKTAHHERAVHEYQLPALDVALATAAAPTYFQAAEMPSRVGGGYIDGGVWANSPAVVGIVEAVHFLGYGLDEIDMLSVGTTEEYVSYVMKRNAGVLGWNTGLLDVMMAGQVTAAQAQARLLLGDRLHRVSFRANKDEFVLDDARPQKLQSLAALGRSVARSEVHRSAISTRFLNGVPVAPFVPSRSVD